MPARLRFTLQGDQPEGPFAHSLALQGLVYGWIKAVDPKRSERLHDDNVTKPFAISPLVPAENNSCIFYVSCLDDSLTGTICEGANRNGKRVRVKGPSKLLVFDLSPEIVFEHEVSWARLECDAVAAYAWRVHLLSPTVCRIKERLLPLPDPANYFASWYYRWEGFAPHSLRMPELLEFVKDRVVVTGFSGETIRVPINEKQTAFPGFVGTADFAVHRPMPADTTVLTALDRLVSLSNCSGTGTQTMRGLGQTRTEQIKLLKEQR
jgi:CRISPR-associated endoribonuclease Cas6